ncbi:spirocyclase AveC family protein [Nocardia gamkensis]|uniref:spirocyclase AveC family protein n=1 Tax=Nocardia gamkensis TaxID=352869 RepID=UPI0036E8E501
MIFALANSSRDVSGTRVGRPPGSYVPARQEFLGISNWYLIFEINTLILFVVFWSTAIYRSKKRGKPTPTLIMLATITTLTVWDPMINWCPLVVFDPRALHFNVDWPWINLSPDIEPWFDIIGYCVGFLLPAWALLPLYRAWARRVGPDAWIARKPRTTLILMAIPVCTVWDTLFEATLNRAGVYTYTHVIPWFSLFPGKPWQFPLTEPLLFGLVLVPTAAMMWVDDQGQTWGETFAMRFKIFRGRPNLGAYAVYFAIFSVLYVGLTGVGFGLLRATGVNTEVARPWPYPETAVFDPHGYYENSGEPGPYYVGTFGGWEHRMPNGGK